MKPVLTPIELIPVAKVEELIATHKLAFQRITDEFFRAARISREHHDELIKKYNAAIDREFKHISGENHVKVDVFQKFINEILALDQRTQVAIRACVAQNSLYTSANRDVSIAKVTHTREGQDVVLRMVSQEGIELTAPVSPEELQELVANQKEYFKIEMLKLMDSKVSIADQEKFIKKYHKALDDEVKKLPEKVCMGDLGKITFALGMQMTEELKRLRMVYLPEARSTSKLRQQLKVDHEAKKLVDWMRLCRDAVDEILTTELKKIEVILRLEASSGRKREDITEDEIAQQILEDEEALFTKRKETLAQLVAEDEKTKKKGEVSVKNSERPVSSAAPLQEEAAPPIESCVDPAVMLRIRYINKLYERKSPPEHERVTRWSDFLRIPHFVDLDSRGQRITRYADLPEDEIRKMLVFHFVPGTEKIFADDLDKSIYTFQTERGLGMIVKVEYLYDDAIKSYYGVLYFGIAEDGKIFHRCIEPWNPSEVVQALQYEPAEMKERPLDGNWVTKSKRPYTLSVSDKGVFTLEYLKVQSRLTIFPLRKDLLREHYQDMYKL